MPAIAPNSNTYAPNKANPGYVQPDACARCKIVDRMSLVTAPGGTARFWTCDHCGQRHESETSQGHGQDLAAKGG